MAENEYENAPMMQSQFYSSALQVRLDTDQIFSDIQKFLEGKVTVATMDNGITKYKTINIGKPKCNEQGRQAILTLVRNVFNPQVVQGNFDEDMYYQYCSQLHTNMARMLFINKYKWNVEAEDYVCIIDSVMNLVRAFMSRLINNKERESYIPTMQHIEHINQTTQPERKKVLGIW